MIHANEPHSRFVFNSLLVLLLLFSSNLSAEEKPIRVFILAGQSNMQGHGRIKMDKDGDLDFTAEQQQFSHLKNDDGTWAERDDVWYFHESGKGEVIKGNLRPGQGANAKSIGPELAFGHVMGQHFDEPVLLIKCAWGGQAIAMTFRPPSAGLPNEEVLTTMLERAKRKRPELTMAEYKQVFGSKYQQTLTEVKEVLSNLDEHFSAYGGQGYVISGFFWHQGWNDGTNKAFAEEYEANMTRFVQDIRKDLGNDSLPFVIATSGMGGPDATGVAGFLGRSIEPAQIAAADKLEQCVAIPTRHFQKHKPGRQKSHWHNSAESYCLVGDAAARAMIELIDLATDEH